MAEQRPSVVLVENHKMLRQSQEAAVDLDARLRLLGDAENGRQGLELIRARCPDVAAVDINMELLDGWGVLEAVLGEELPTRVVFSSVIEDPAVVQRALNRGAVGYMSKGIDGADFCDLLLLAARGRTAISADLKERLVEHLAASGGSEALSSRELEVLRCMAADVSSEEIGRRLHLSRSTVEKHKASIRAKLGVGSSPAAVAAAFRRGLIE